MTALARLLFPLPATRRSTTTLLSWWESRRPTYNLIVGATGLVTVIAIQAMSILPPHMPLTVPWQLVVVYALCANIFYSFGFAAEALLQRLYGDDVAPVGPTLFRHGLVFSVGLTLFPIGVAWLGYLFTALRYVLH
ncbi:MAG: hypothetical protein ABJE47_18080 [bacterium]